MSDNLLFIMIVFNAILLVTVTFGMLVVLGKITRRELMNQQNGLEVGIAFPTESLTTILGEHIQFSANRGTILLFTSATCAFCKILYPAVNSFHRRNKLVQIIVVMEGAIELVQAVKDEMVIEAPVVLMNKVLFQMVKITSFPYSNFISHNGLVLAKGAVHSEADFELLMLSAKSHPEYSAKIKQAATA